MTTVEKIHDLEAIEQLRGDWERLRETSEFETLSIGHNANNGLFDFCDQGGIQSVRIE